MDSPRVDYSLFIMAAMVIMLTNAEEQLGGLRAFPSNLCRVVFVSVFIFFAAASSRINDFHYI
jgi:hypothetical protein